MRLPWGASRDLRRPARPSFRQGNAPSIEQRCGTPRALWKCRAITNKLANCRTALPPGRSRWGRRRGALSCARVAGGKSIGLSIELPHEQFANAYISPELSLNFHYFFMRKLWFAQIAKALIVFPGGFGTMDELWEMMTLLQTGKLSKNNMILIYGRRYWEQVLNFRAMVRWV